MPAGVRKGKSKKCKYEIYNKDTGKKEGCSSSKTKAKKSARARNAAAHGWKPTKKKK